jgi:lipopolysaccharide/colanic/teichoic acid biosynthesis glycosyltransferase
MQRRIDHDLWYIENWSFWLDMRILLMTVSRILRSADAY